MVVASFVISSLLLLFIWGVTRASYGAWNAALGCVAACFLGLVTMSPLALGQAAMTFVAMILCGIAGIRGRGLFGAAVGLAALVYGGYGVNTVSEFRHLARLRASYPVTSLAKRLSYEQPASTTDGLATEINASQRRLGVALEVELKNQEREEKEAGYRNYDDTFRRLHQATAADFVFGVGFGASRMGYIRPSHIRLPSPPPAVPQPTTREPNDSYAIVGDLPASPEPTYFDFQRMHRSSRLDFTAPERWGYVQSREHTVGFGSHGFRALPKLDNQERGAAEWQTVRIELVSLLRQSEPRVYVSKNLPKMDELRDAPTRVADEFERSAVEKLRTDEDVVAHTATNVIHLVGSIRASEACLQCHTARRGDLLGALSYELRRVTPLPEPKPQPTGIPLTFR